MKTGIQVIINLIQYTDEFMSFCFVCLGWQKTAEFTTRIRCFSPAPPKRHPSIHHPSEKTFSKKLTIINYTATAKEKPSTKQLSHKMTVKKKKKTKKTTTTTTTTTTTITTERCWCIYRVFFSLLGMNGKCFSHNTMIIHSIVNPTLLCIFSPFGSHLLLFGCWSFSNPLL